MVATADTHSDRLERRLDPGRATPDERETAARRRMLRMIRGVYGNVAERDRDRGQDDDVVLVHGIPFTTCEHHLLPCLGKAHVAYLGGGRTVSASGLARTVNTLAHRSHGQRLADDLADAVALHLSAEAVAVVVETDHVCIEWSDAVPGDRRAVAVRGRFQAEPALGAEVISLLSTEAGSAGATGIVPQVLFEGIPR